MQKAWHLHTDSVWFSMFLKDENNVLFCLLEQNSLLFNAS